MGRREAAPASQQIVAALIDAGEMTRTALQKSIGRSPAATDKAIFSLRQSGVLATPVRGSVSLSSKALAKVKRGQPILDGRGGVLWAPAAD
jgi:hypothetical protein